MIEIVAPAHDRTTPVRARAVRGHAREREIADRSHVRSGVARLRVAAAVVLVVLVAAGLLAAGIGAIFSFCASLGTPYAAADSRADDTDARVAEYRRARQAGMPALQDLTSDL